MRLISQIFLCCCSLRCIIHSFEVHFYSPSCINQFKMWFLTLIIKFQLSRHHYVVRLFPTYPVLVTSWTSFPHSLFCFLIVLYCLSLMPFIYFLTVTAVSFVWHFYPSPPAVSLFLSLELLKFPAIDSSLPCLPWKIFNKFFLGCYLFIFRGKGGRTREREKTSMCGCLSYTPIWGPGLQPRRVPWLGIKPATRWFRDWHSVPWATPARVQQVLYMTRFILSLPSPNITIS